MSIKAQKNSGRQSKICTNKIRNLLWLGTMVMKYLTVLVKQALSTLILELIGKICYKIVLLNHIIQYLLLLNLQYINATQIAADHKIK